MAYGLWPLKKRARQQKLVFLPKSFKLYECASIKMSRDFNVLNAVDGFILVSLNDTLAKMHITCRVQIARIGTSWTRFVGKARTTKKKSKTDSSQKFVVLRAITRKIVDLAPMIL
jgi:hypothetical protein